jgi:chromosome segregation ATPase
VDTITLIYALSVLASGIAAILAWVAKIRWSREFKDAKEAHIETLREQIATLERLSPPVLLSWVESVERIAEKQIATLENQLKEREEDLRESQHNIELLTRQDQIRYEIIVEAEKQRDEARAALEETEAALIELHRVQEESKDLRKTVRGRPARLNLPSTVTSEGRVEELEEFANNLASDEPFAREVSDNLKIDSCYYDGLLKPPLPSQN